MKKALRIGAWGWALSGLALAADFDLRITNAHIVDGTGAAAFTGNVAVRATPHVAVRTTQQVTSRVWFSG
jgi:hypothetical protein